MKRKKRSKVKELTWEEARLALTELRACWVHWACAGEWDIDFRQYVRRYRSPREAWESGTICLKHVLWLGRRLASDGWINDAVFDFRVLWCRDGDGPSEEVAAEAYPWPLIAWALRSIARRGSAVRGEVSR